MPTTIKKARKIIHEMVSLEYGLYQLNDQGASIRNVRLRKDRVIYDVILFDYDGDKSSRQNNVETSLKDIENFQKEQPNKNYRQKHESRGTMKTKAGTFTSVWDDGSIITTPATLNENTGEVTVHQSADVDIDGSLEREYFSLNGYEDDEFEVCTTCHSYILKTVMNPSIGKTLNEEQVCSNPDCESNL